MTDSIRRSIVGRGATAAALAMLVACPSGQDGTPGPGAALTLLTLTPQTVTMGAGQLQPFVVSGDWSDGGSSAPVVAFTATGGAVSPTGVYTAGAVPGDYRVVATHAASGLADTSAVTISAVAAGLVNECATPEPGWLWCDDFDQVRTSSYFEVDDAGGLFTRVAAVGNGGSYGMRARWNTVGQVSAGSLHLAVGKTPQTYFDPVDAGTVVRRELFWRLYFKKQAGWVGGGADKLSRALVFASATTWATAATAPVWSGQGGSINFLSIDPVSGTDLIGNVVTTTYNDFANSRYLGQVYGPTPVFDAAHAGSWYCVEAHAKLNQVGASDGLFEIWLDGNLEARREGMNWVGSFATYGFNAVFVENYWNAGSPAVQERYLDNFVVSTQRIGC